MSTNLDRILRDAKSIVESAKASGLIRVTDNGTAREAAAAERNARYERIRTARLRRREALSKKLLGGKGYYHARKEGFAKLGLTAQGKPFKRWWTGLSAVDLGHTEYMRQWRALRRERAAKGAV